jgi:hypothetical protein
MYHSSNRVSLSHSAIYAGVASICILSLAMALFFVSEPKIGFSQSDTEDFRIRQTITGETAFLVNPSNVTMNGSISGITGGSATGTTRFVVKSNNATGYYVEIDFFDNAGNYAMLGDKSGSDAIRDYIAGAAEPTYNFTTASAAQLAYAVYSSTTADTDQSFLNNGSACNAGATQTIEKCWKAPSTTGFRVVGRNNAATAGATSTIYFKVHVPSGATPVPTAETYTATATLSVFTQ